MEQFVKARTAERKAKEAGVSIAEKLLPVALSFEKWLAQNADGVPVGDGGGVLSSEEIAAIPTPEDIQQAVDNLLATRKEVVFDYRVRSAGGVVLWSGGRG